MEKKGFLTSLKEGLAKTHASLTGRIDRVIGGKKINAEVLEDLEEILVTADLGVITAGRLIEEIKKESKKNGVEDAKNIKDYLRKEIKAIVKKNEIPLEVSDFSPFTIMIVGVNGVGKTTTIAKMAHRFIKEGKEVLLVAADTFRAAGIEQLEIWGHRAGAEVIKQQMGSDPSAVVYDALQSAKSRRTDVVIVDTAGRLHTKVNLMEELKKIKRVMGGCLTGAPHEVLLVLDAVTGQNSISQAKMFHEAMGITGIALTKLDGTAKGGILIGLSNELQLPIRYIGIGEGMEDLRDFRADEFAEALF
jgi:fused signal recognition particle receptor